MNTTATEFKHPSTATDITKLLESKGIRPTMHRTRITEYVLRERWHFTADEVLDWAQKSLEKVSRATVYNTLNELVGAGLLRTFTTSTSASVIFDSNLDPHIHVFDCESRRYIDVDLSTLELKAPLAEQFDIEQIEVLIKGRRKSQN